MESRRDGGALSGHCLMTRANFVAEKLESRLPDTHAGRQGIRADAALTVR